MQILLYHVSCEAHIHFVQCKLRAEAISGTIRLSKFPVDSKLDLPHQDSRSATHPQIL